MKLNFFIYSTVLIGALYAAVGIDLPVKKEPVECATGIALARFKDQRWRPWRPVLASPIYYRVKTHVRVHYTRSGPDSTTLAFAESVAVHAESCWVRAQRFGWAVPPPDQGVGGDDLFDIYVRCTDSIIPGLETYGISQSDSAYTDPYVDGHSSFLVLTKDSIPQPFPRYTRLRPLVAHEFHHSCQFRYSAEEEASGWFYENTSVWMEDLLFPGDGTLYWRTFTYTPNALLNTNRHITDTLGGYEYAGGLWPLFLAEYYGPETPRMIWDLCGNHSGSHTLYDTDSFLDITYGCRFVQALGHYAIWRYFTGDRDDGMHFANAELCTTSVLLRRHTSFPASGNQGTSGPRGNGGTHFIHFETSGTQDLTVSFDGYDDVTWRVYVVGLRNGVATEQRILLDTLNAGSITIPQWMFTTAVLVPVVTSWGDGIVLPPPVTFTYSASYNDAANNIAEAGSKKMVLYQNLPNPVGDHTTVAWMLAEGASGSLEILDITGRLVRGFKLIGTGKPAALVWDRIDANGNSIARGVYFYVLRSQGEQVVRKVVLY